MGYNPNTLRTPFRLETIVTICARESLDVIALYGTREFLATERHATRVSGYFAWSWNKSAPRHGGDAEGPDPMAGLALLLHESKFSPEDEVTKIPSPTGLEGRIGGVHMRRRTRADWSYDYAFILAYAPTCPRSDTGWPRIRKARRFWTALRKVVASFSRRCKVCIFIGANGHVGQDSDGVRLCDLPGSDGSLPPIGPLYPELINHNGIQMVDLLLAHKMIACSTYDVGEIPRGGHRLHTWEDHRETPHRIDYVLLNGWLHSCITVCGVDVSLGRSLENVNAKGDPICDHLPVRVSLSVDPWAPPTVSPHVGKVKWDHDKIAGYLRHCTASEASNEIDGSLESGFTRCVDVRRFACIGDVSVMWHVWFVVFLTWAHINFISAPVVRKPFMQPRTQALIYERIYCADRLSADAGGDSPAGVFSRWRLRARCQRLSRSIQVMAQRDKVAAIKSAEQALQDADNLKDMRRARLALFRILPTPAGRKAKGGGGNTKSGHVDRAVYDDLVVKRFDGNSVSAADVVPRFDPLVYRCRTWQEAQDHVSHVMSLHTPYAPLPDDVSSVSSVDDVLSVSPDPSGVPDENGDCLYVLRIVPPDVRAGFQLIPDHGDDIHTVCSVESGSVAERAGLVEGMFARTINGHHPFVQHFAAADSYEACDTLRIAVVRAGPSLPPSAHAPAVPIPPSAPVSGDDALIRQQMNDLYRSLGRHNPRGGVPPWSAPPALLRAAASIAEPSCLQHRPLD